MHISNFTCFALGFVLTSALIGVLHATSELRRAQHYLKLAQVSVKRSAITLEFIKALVAGKPTDDFPDQEDLHQLFERAKRSLTDAELADAVLDEELDRLNIQI